MASKKFIAAGHICLDIQPVIPDQHTDRLTDVLKPGKTVEVGRADVHPGGAVANTGMAMQYFGADVTLAARIGKDAFGDLISQIAERSGAKSALVRDPEASTAYTNIVAIPGIDRIFLHNQGANAEFTSEDVPEEMLKDAALLHFGYPPHMRKIYSNGGAELTRLMKRAKECGAATSLDMAMVDSRAESGHMDWEKVLEQTLKYVDFFVPSFEEICYMLDRPRYETLRAKSGSRDITEVIDIDRDVRPLAERMLALGSGIALIKCGVPGIYMKTADRARIGEISSRMGLDPEKWADLDRFEASYVPDAVRSGTGAGDTAIAAFLTAAADGETPETALRLASAAGASCVTAYDALSGLKPLPELKRRIIGGWKKVTR